MARSVYSDPMRSLALGTAILAAPLFTAQAQTYVARILTGVSETYANANEYRFAVTKKGEESGVMKIAVRKPDRFRFEADGRVVDGADAFSKVLIVSDGGTTWNYRAEENSYTKKRVAPALLDTEPAEVTPETFVLQAEAVFLTRYARFAKAADHARVLRKENVQSGGQSVACTVVEIEAPLPGYRDTYTWWVDEKTHLVLREDTRPASSRRPLSSTIYTEAAIGEPIPEQMFHFTPPPGARLVDRFEP